MKTRSLLFASIIAALLCQPPTAVGSVGGAFVGEGGGIPCGQSGTLYSNLTSQPINFELSISSNAAFSCNDATISWTDANAHAQSVTVVLGSFTSVASSLPANGAISYSSVMGFGGWLGLSWQLERAPAQSVAGQTTIGLNQTGVLCGSSGTLFSNQRTSAVSLDFAVTNGSGCSLTVSWTDGSGHPQTLSSGLGGTSQGASTSLPAGGVISWMSTIGNGGYIAASWQVERVVTSKLW